MRRGPLPAKHARLRRVARRTVEYAVTVVVALLCSYWIVRGNW